jgi:hypothetical protein
LDLLGQPVDHLIVRGPKRLNQKSCPSGERA